MARHTKEFKLEAIRLLNQKDKPITDIAKELGVKRTLLYRWREELKNKNPEEVFNGQTGPKSAQRDELTRLRRENAGLKEDIVILKKAAAYFAKDLK